ncbi:hypothetical protein NHX12_004751 [Muraenolepis orangiensis]|uniref:Neurocan n=1 Tax=Muraenolepis orangiensis TaxID=630683 RepID=A0A9Q0DW34_9TELE|nr:hypothetical protein NHX12_004751 [Muraenolepis orangiensis]
MRRITHPTVQSSLAGRALLPCVFPPQDPSPAGRLSPPHILWTVTRPPAGGHRAPEEQTVLSARGDVIKVNKAFAGRISLPEYLANPLNATMAMDRLRTNDSGTYHCQVVMGNDYERDTVPLVVSGVVFHYKTLGARYALTFADAQLACQENAAQIATPAQLWAAFDDGFTSCAPGWLSDQTVRYSVQMPELGCYGHEEFSAGVRNYGKKDPKELFDVYCFARELDGEVFHSSVPGRLSLSSASDRCVSLGGQLATVGQLYLAWKAGLDSCAPGWLSDGSVRYPVSWPHPECGGDLPGVRTVASNATSENNTALYDAYCYRGNGKIRGSISKIYTSMWKPWSYLERSRDEADSPDHTTDGTATSRDFQTASIGGQDLSPSNWTGLVDLEDENIHSGEASSDPWPSESPEQYVRLHISPGQSTLDWGDPLKLRMDSDMFLRPQVPATTYPPPTSTDKKVISKIVKSIWKPWSYLAGVADEEDGSPAPPTGAPGTEQTDVGSPTPRTVSPGALSWGAWFGVTSKNSETKKESPISQPPSVQTSTDRALTTERHDDSDGKSGQTQSSTTVNDTEPVTRGGSWVMHRRSNSIPIPKTVPKHIAASNTLLRILPFNSLIPLITLSFPILFIVLFIFTLLPIPDPDTSRNSSTSSTSHWVPVGGEVAPGVEVQTKGSLYNPPTLSPFGPPEEDEPAWSHSLGSGAPLPGNMDEEVSRFNLTSTTTTTVPAGESQPCVTNPCLHGGKCLPQGQGYSCYCPQGYTGENCEIDVDDCQSDPFTKGRCVKKKFHGHCYRYFTHRHTWEDAEKDCREHSAHLSSVTSSTEQDFINGLGHDNAWVGLNDRTVEEDFQWTDSNDLVYENWRESQPDNFFAGGEDCVVTIAHEDGKWNDVPCNYNLPYICKKGTVLCGAPPTVENAHLIGRRRSHYDIHSVVRYQCSEGFFQRHIPTTRCRADGNWERPKIICTKSRRSHRYRRHHHQHRERRSHRRHGADGHRAREDAHDHY